MEPAGRVHCLPLHHRHRSGGDPGSGVPHQPHHHPRHAGPQDRPGPQAAQDGQGYPGSVGHCHAGIAAGRLSEEVGYEEHFATSLYLLPRLGTLAFYSSYCFSFLPPLVWSFLEDLVSYIAYDLIILQNLHCVFILSSYLSTIHHRRLSIYRM